MLVGECLRVGACDWNHRGKVWGWVSSLESVKERRMATRAHCQRWQGKGEMMAEAQNQSWRGWDDNLVLHIGGSGGDNHNRGST